MEATDTALEVAKFVREPVAERDVIIAIVVLLVRDDSCGRIETGQNGLGFRAAAAGTEHHSRRADGQHFLPEVLGHCMSKHCWIPRLVSWKSSPLVQFYRA